MAGVMTDTSAEPAFPITDEADPERAPAPFGTPM
jgi:hypothetical protein